MQKKKVNPKKRPATQADVNKAKKEAREVAIHTAYAIFFTVLHDKEGWGVKRMARLWEHINDLSESVVQGYVTIQDLEKTLYEEVGIELKGAKNGRD